MFNGVTHRKRGKKEKETLLKLPSMEGPSFIHDEGVLSRDRFHEECGIVGIYGTPEAATLAYLGLYALQHRGQEASGIVTYDSEKFHHRKGIGQVLEVFSESDLRRLRGHAAIGHNRYATAGGHSLDNVQPFMGKYNLQNLAMAHNGNLVNTDALRAELTASGSFFQSTTDSEIIMDLICRSTQPALIPKIVEALSRVEGAYCLVFLSETGLIGVRDPYGVRPLCLGKMKTGYALASESCAFDLIGAEYLREIEPGEILHIHEQGLVSLKPFSPVPVAKCVFEYVYFARPDSTVFSKSVYGIRKRLGRELAAEDTPNADLVIAVPDSGVMAALGYGEVSHLPYDVGMIRSHYIGRTFIEPQQKIRNFGVKIKLNAVREVIEGKRVVVVDDSLVRGTTSRKIVQMLRAAGAKEVHLRISSPPIVSPCFYGIDTPTRNELLAYRHTVEEIRKAITADSLHYLSMEGMFRAIDGTDIKKEHDFCAACFSGHYPLPFPDNDPQMRLF